VSTGRFGSGLRYVEQSVAVAVGVGVTVAFVAVAAGGAGVDEALTEGVLGGGVEATGFGPVACGPPEQAVTRAHRTAAGTASRERTS
jgi:hypothetical protein